MEEEQYSLDYKVRNDKKLGSKYNFLGRLESGCFGTIYKVINLSSKRTSALKIEYLEN